MKKVMAVLTAFIIIISMFVMPSNAASVSYSASSVSGAKGDTVTVSVKISSSVQIWGANVMLGYNSSELQYVSSSKGGAVSSGSLNNTGSSVNFSGMFSAKSGTVFTVKFKILKSSGSSTLTLTSTENIDSDANKYECSTTNGKVTVTNPATSIKLDKTSVTLKKGETAQLTATVTPSDATNKTVTYTTSDKYVATVSSSGKITAVGGGTATITAKAGGKTATCKVSVNVAQTGIALSGSESKTVELGKTITLKVAKVPSDATDSFSTTWSSADETIATVSSKGVVTGVALGTTTITAKQNSWSVTYKITVVEAETESVSEEDTTEEDTTEIPEETSETETTTAPEETTEPTTGNKGFWNSIVDDINDDNNKVTKPRYYATMVVTAVATALVAVAVTFLVTSGYYKSKSNKFEVISDEEEN